MKKKVKVKEKVKEEEEEKLQNGESGDAGATATVIVDDKPPEPTCDESDDKRVQGEPLPHRLFT